MGKTLRSLVWPSSELSDSVKAKMAEVEMLVRRGNKQEEPPK